MPIAKVQLPDGRIAKFDVPDGTTPEQVTEFAQQQFSSMGASAAQPGPTDTQRIQASAPMRFIQGMRDPIDAGAQLLERGAHAFGVDTAGVQKAINSGAKKILPDSLSPFVDAYLSPNSPTEDAEQNEAAYQAAREADGAPGAGPGFDAARLAGNIASPVNAALARALPMKAVGIPGKALYGAKMGAAGGLMQPVNDMQDGQSYWMTKLAQAGIGAGAGSVLTPLASKLGGAIARRWNAFRSNGAPVNADKVINESLGEIGQTADDIPASQLAALREQVNAAFKQNGKLDIPAALRKQDFDALAIPATDGQITRDATQFARERNLRGVAGVGEPLMSRFEQQNQALQKAVGEFGGNKSSEQYQAGAKLAEALKRIDDGMSERVSAAYKAARESSGKDFDVPLKGMAQDYARVLSDFGDKVPSGVRNRMEELGLMSGAQKKVFSVEDAEKLLKTINDNISNDPATNKALGELRGAVKNAVLSADDKGGVFARARKEAAKRFALQDAIPALKAASTDSTASDDFVRKFVIGGKTDNVTELAKLLKSAEPEAYQEARNQIGATLQRAAFGENTSGDKIFSPERFARALREMGEEKLSAFYSPEEISKLKTASRVGSYINTTPTASPVNNSNTAGALMNLLTKVPGVPAAASLANAIRNTVDNSGAVNRALAAKVPIDPADLTPEQITKLAKLLAVGSAGAGQTAATPLR